MMSVHMTETEKRTQMPKAEAQKLKLKVFNKLEKHARMSKLERALNLKEEHLSIDMIYFSFTTLTTLGYGDITPVSYTAKMWSITEAMIGVMFLAVMISRVVSLFGSKKKN